MRVLTVNPGSSSLKLALVANGVQERQVTVDRWDGTMSGPLSGALAEWSDVDAVAVRFVHGGNRRWPVVLDRTVLDELAGLSRLAPLHQPGAVMAAEAVLASMASVPVVACFDTSFHASMPTAARLYGLPVDLTRKYGLYRYGFHGLSCQYSLRRVAEIIDVELTAPRVVCVHMGAGVSVTAIRDGVGVDTSMGFTPLEGAVMATRSGSVDPGVLLHLLDTAAVRAEGLSDLLYHRSGLAGMTGTSGDLRDVLAARRRGSRDAELAVDVYVHRIRREIGAMAMSLDQVDAVVFTGGVATYNPDLVARIAAGLEVLGVRVVRGLLAAAGDRVVSPLGALPRVFVITAREDLELATQAEAVVASRSGVPS
ncbi:acetate/propionate family kinase [Actinocrispum wychmicini]|uniref:Acetate kinase n=1 Tax=Actinocrispum wychmicini TaxID=1213861 RepID=A0A4R2JXB0_9PSEU|nr:acetate kinase [Actinocrispum wychmicini]TCO61976.1 acetate kinase [Actinocrispum wychmicini]